MAQQSNSITVLLPETAFRSLRAIASRGVRSCANPLDTLFSCESVNEDSTQRRRPANPEGRDLLASARQCLNYQPAHTAGLAFRSLRAIASRGARSCANPLDTLFSCESVNADACAAWSSALRATGAVMVW